MKNTYLIVLATLLAFLFSCKNEKQDNILTERIQYDVPIKNNKPDANWWVNNIVGPDREDLVKSILEKAKNGDIVVYDYFNDILTPRDVKKIGIDTLYKEIKRDTPPYDFYDTMIISRLRWEDITKLRFLEEWAINEDNMHIEKTVIGIAPVKMVSLHGNTYSMPLFWYYFDDKYPGKLKN